MKYKYGYYTEKQFSEYKKRLHNLVHWLLVYADNNNPILKEYFDTVQYKLSGLNEVLNSPSQLVEIMSLIESAKIEYNKENFNHKRYRKTILDVHDLIDKIPED